MAITILEAFLNFLNPLNLESLNTPFLGSIALLLFLIGLEPEFEGVGPFLLFDLE